MFVMIKKNAQKEANQAKKPRFHLRKPHFLPGSLKELCTFTLEFPRDNTCSQMFPEVAEFRRGRR